jgi:hypothetical protein
MCLRPCQQVVGVEEYGHEVERVVQFLATDGRSLSGVISSARDRLSQEMNFEEAARQHKRLEKLDGVLRLKDDLAADIDRLHGVAVTASRNAEAVELWFLYQGCWQPPYRFSVTGDAAFGVSLDKRLREAIAGLEWTAAPGKERAEHLALLARWYYSSWREGGWVSFQNPDNLPLRKLVGVISRVAQGR